MAITIEIQQVVEEKDGRYTVYVNAIRGDGTVIIRGKTFQCINAEGLKADIKPKFEQLIRMEERKEQIRVLAQGVIDEIMSEVVQ